MLQARTLVPMARQESNRGDMTAAETTLQRSRQTLLNSVGETDYYLGIVSTELADHCSTSDRPGRAL